MRGLSYFLLSSGLFLLCFSCGGNSKTKDSGPALPQTHTADSIPKIQIGKTGLTVALPGNFEIKNQSGNDYTVYLFQALDTNLNKGGGGIYFGYTPDEHPPTVAYQQKDSSGIFLGKPSKITKYTTAKYVWIETEIEEGDAKIQTWFYAFNPSELADISRMMNSISR